VHDGIMYLAQSNNVVHALDATNGNLIWEYKHPLPKMEGSYVKRQLVRARNSIALYGDRVFLTTGVHVSSRWMRVPARSNGTFRSPIITRASAIPAARWWCGTR
jgi:outer membrane protein assembly factor BamB